MHWKIQIVNISITRDMVSHIRSRYDCTQYTYSVSVNSVMLTVWCRFITDLLHPYETLVAPSLHLCCSRDLDLLQTCYTHIKHLSHLRYTFVAAVMQTYYKLVTPILNTCLTLVTPLLQPWCRFLDLLHPYYTLVATSLHLCCSRDVDLLQTCYTNIKHLSHPRYTFV